MAFLNRVANVLKQTAGKHVSSQFPAANASLFQAMRSMSTSSKLFVGGLSYSTDETSLREAFAQYGEVVEARVIMDRESGRSRGFGFVTFTSSEDASSAIQAFDGKDLQGRTVRVNYATERVRGGGFGGGGYGGGGYGGGGYGGGGYGGGYDGQGGSYGGGGYQGGGRGGGYGGNNQYQSRGGSGYGGSDNYPSGGGGSYGGADSVQGGGSYSPGGSNYAGGQAAFSPAGESQEPVGSYQEGDVEAGNDDFGLDEKGESNDYADTRR